MRTRKQKVRRSNRNKTLKKARKSKNKNTKTRKDSLPQKVLSQNQKR